MRTKPFFNSRAYDGNSLALIPGPLRIDWTENSESMEQEFEYGPNQIIRFFTNFNHVKMDEGGKGDLYDIRLRWSSGDHFIIFKKGKNR